MLSERRTLRQQELLLGAEQLRRVDVEERLTAPDRGAGLVDVAWVAAQCLDADDLDRFGAECLGQLALNMDADDVPVVVVTGKSNDPLVAESIKLGAADYIAQSTLSPETFGRTIDNVIEKAALKRDLKEQTGRLRAATETLQTQHEEITNFYQNVSHEVKTPLTAIREFIALMLDGVTGEINEYFGLTELVLDTWVSAGSTEPPAPTVLDPPRDVPTDAAARITLAA